MKTVIAHFQSPISKRKRENAVALRAGKIGNRQSSIGNAFTLIELLVVISIIGILAGLSVPVLKNLGKDNAQISAVRQILDDVARARQLAISRHTTIFMVFVPTNFCDTAFVNTLNTIPVPADRMQAFTTASNVVPDQLTGYAFLTLRSVGDQPGQGTTNYIGEWKSLPEGTYIAPQKFYFSGAYIQIPQWQNLNARPAITNFARAYLPFPTARSPLFYVPYLAFDYQGRLVSEAGGVTDAYIPLVQGHVTTPMDANKQPRLDPSTPTLPADISETPPGNSGIGNNNFSFQVIHIDALTGRASSEQYKMP